VAAQKILLEASIAARLSVGLERYDHRSDWDAPVMVVNAMAPIFPVQYQRALATRVSSGMGLVVLHASNVIPEEMTGYNESDSWQRMIGSRFLSHPPFCHFRVQIQHDHPVTAGLSDFEIDDELYITEWTGDRATVLANAHWEGADHPMVYVREHGEGRICYIALGHDMRAWGHPAYQKLLAQATRWAARKDASE
jgi:type 1 glutamine amidotransferase